MLIVLFNLISLWLATKGKRISWCFSILGSILAACMFLNSKMLFSFLFNVFITINSIIALFTWKRTKEFKDTADIFFYSVLYILIGLGLLIFQICISEINAFDIIGPAAAIVATILLVKKEILAWWYWVLSDITYIICGFWTLNYEFILIYSVMLGVTIYGLRRNYKRLNAF